MDSSQNGYWRVATMLLRPYYQRKAKGCSAWGSGAVRRPLMRTGHGKAWAPNTAWLCLPWSFFQGRKTVPSFDSLKVPICFGLQGGVSRQQTEGSHCRPPPEGDCGPTAWLTQAVALCFTSFTSHPATSVSLSWFLKGFLSTWQGHSSLFPQEIWPKMHFPPLSVTQPLVLKQEFL